MTRLLVWDQLDSGDRRASGGARGWAGLEAGWGRMGLSNPGLEGGLSSLSSLMGSAHLSLLDHLQGGRDVECCGGT